MSENNLGPNVPKPDTKDANGLDTNARGIPQRANLPVRERETLDLWNRIDVYHQGLKQKTGRGDFILHDGPPFSNGDIHIGHAFNKILKDVILKFKSMQGYTTPYVPGWDNNGLPIEVGVGREFREKGLRPTSDEMRHRCRESAQHWFERQREQFIRLGIRGDWDRPYLTMASNVAAKELEVFADLTAKGYFYRGLRPVHWSLVDETALADHEVEYEDRTDPSIFVRFRLRTDPDAIFGAGADPDRCYTIIWTTTPWTIPANVAVAAGPEVEYVVVLHDDRRYLVAANRLGATMLAANFAGWTVVHTVRGKALAGLIFEHPFLKRAAPLVLADYVSTEDGTGLVHTAPGHGKEDFLTGLKYNLPVVQVLTGNGYFNDEAGPELAGMRKDAGELKVLELLTGAGALLAQEKIVHSFPHGWRSHDPLVFRATEQWFLNIDNDGHRERCLREIDKVAWYPQESISRIKAMVGGRPDWCITRQRSWEIGIPVFYAQPSGTPLLTRESVLWVRDLVARAGTDAWFDTPVDQIIPAGFKHPTTGETEFVKEDDILDVWFDSGSTNQTVLGQWPELSYPADVYLEGGDQHRGWFNSSLMIGVGTTGHAPYRQVITNGWTLDEDGRKMSKSKLNGVAPAVVVDKYGADVLRLWVCSTDYFGDVRVGDKVLEQVATNYRTLRNTLRFAVGNLYVTEPFDFDPAVHVVAYADLPEIDRWALHRLNKVVQAAVQGYEKYEFQRVTQSVLAFCTTDLSAFYFDVLKDRLYASAPSSSSRRAAQTVLFEIVSTLSRLLSPILSFTAEEVWQKLVMPDKPASVQLAALPADRPDFYDDALEKRWDKLLAVRDEVNKALEGVRKRLELAITISAGNETYDLLNAYLNQLPGVLLVSEVALRRIDDAPLSVINNGPAAGAKCSRCWIAVGDGGDEPASACAGGCVRAWQVRDVHGSERIAARRLISG